MKILQVNTVIAYGSTGIICQNIAKGLMAAGHDCMIVYGRGKAVSDLKTYKIGCTLEQAVHYGRSRYLDQHGLSSKYATYQLLNLIKNYRPDIIHLHNIHGYYLNYKILFAELAKLRIPVVWLLHDQWAVSGGPAYIDKPISFEELREVKLNRTKEQKNQYPSVSKFSLNRFEKNFLDKYNTITLLENLHIVTPSNWLNEFVSESYLKKFSITTIYNGFDSQKFNVLPVENNDQIIILGAANIWDERKGLSYFFKLALDLDERFKIILIGIDKSIKLPENIVRVEKVTNEEMVKYYNMADVFINPTLGDNFPSVNVEAQLCGTPVITFDTGGSKESICLETGKVIPQGDYEALKKEVKNIRKKTESVIKQTRNAVLQFSVDNMVINYFRLYKEIIQKGSIYDGTNSENSLC